VWWAIVMGSVILGTAVVFRRSLQMHAVPALSKFFVNFDWRPLVKDQAALTSVLFMTLSAAVFHFLSKHAEMATSLAALSLIFFTGAAVVARLELYASPGRLLGASAFVAAVLSFLLVQPGLYAGRSALEPIWRATLARLADYTMGG